MYTHTHREENINILRGDDISRCEKILP